MSYLMSTYLRTAQHKVQWYHHYYSYAWYQTYQTVYTMLKPHCSLMTVRYTSLFDRRLTWKDHIEYVVTKCKKRLNLMRAVSGRCWGASQRSLIRSVIDYGAIAYDNASESQLAKLDSIQYQALKISTGAMVVTPLATLQVHCVRSRRYSCGDSNNTYSTL